ncbi:hypothetical protein HON36_03075 [Candidatus Parcubacteria bacterium]|nr:hypothetical protein [Candidatus Parcubacteria bacterium]
MKNKNIIQKLKKAELKGRGGANFPTYLKWQMVKDQKATKKYIVANGSEGEPDTNKDGWIVKNHPELLIEGLKLALKAIDHSEAIIYLRKDYFKKYQSKLQKLIGKLPITIFKERGGYLSGEETTVCQEIENKIARPRIKPPFPGQAGVYGFPTLINNIETFYYAAKIADDDYEKTRLITILGKVKNKGVFELPINWPIDRILENTRNIPDFDFFVQMGGGASGEVLLQNELHHQVIGSGSIVIYDKNNTDPYAFMRRIMEFFMEENCDKCTPCREGTYRLMQMIRDRSIDKKVLDDLLFVLENTSFCALGKMVVPPMRSAVKKLI